MLEPLAEAEELASPDAFVELFAVELEVCDFTFEDLLLVELADFPLVAESRGSPGSVKYKLDVLAARIQAFAEKHRRLFLVIVFAIILAVMAFIRNRKINFFS